MTAVDEVEDDRAGAFYRGLTHSLYGESESGKSWVAQWAVIETLANGGRALYVDFESSADQIVPRLVALAGGAGVALLDVIDNLHYVQPQGRMPQAFIDERLTEGAYDLAIVDGVTAAVAMWGAKSNSGDEFTAWHHDLPERIARRTGAAVVVIDHVGKVNERGNGGGGSRFAIGSQAKMAVLTGAGYLVDLVRPFSPGHDGEAIMRVGKDRPGDVRAHSGRVSANRLQPWARVEFVTARDGSTIELRFHPLDDERELDGGDGGDGDAPGFAGDIAPWTEVVVPDEIGELLKGKGKAHAHNILRVMFRSATVDGLTRAEIQGQVCEGLQGNKRHVARSRFGEAWACLDRSLAIAHGGAGASRWVLASHVEDLLKRHNAR